MLPRPKNGGIDFRNKQKVNTFISWWFEVNLNKEMVVVFLFANNWLRRSFHHAFWKDRLAFVSKLNSKSRKKKKRKKIQYPSWKSFSTEYNKFKFLLILNVVENLDYSLISLWKKLILKQIGDKYGRWTGRFESFTLKQEKN